MAVFKNSHQLARSASVFSKWGCNRCLSLTRSFPSSSSYSSDALDFETEHKLDPVFDSPRMSRRSLRLVTTARAAGDGPAGDSAAR